MMPYTNIFVCCINVSTCHVRSVKNVYDLQMNVSVNGRGGRVHITEVVDDIKQVTRSEFISLLSANLSW